MKVSQGTVILNLFCIFICLIGTWILNLKLTENWKTQMKGGEISRFYLIIDYWLNIGGSTFNMGSIDVKLNFTSLWASYVCCHEKAQKVWTRPLIPCWFVGNSKETIPMPSSGQHKRRRCPAKRSVYGRSLSGRYLYHRADSRQPKIRSYL